MRIGITSTLPLVALVGLLALQLVGCGPSAPKSLPLPEIKVKDVGGKINRQEDLPSYIFVDDFIDARTEQAIAEVDGKKVPYSDEISRVIRGGMRGALEKKGFVFSDTAPIVLSGELRKWKALVDGGFKSTISSEASLYVEILDPANKRIYAGVYNGFSTVEGPSLGSEDIQSALATAMGEAIQQVLNDQQLVKLLNSF